MGNTPIKRALISVSNKSGIVEFSRALADYGVEIVSTGGTAKLLAAEGIAAIDISEYTGFAEIMDGRVKTLHPNVHGGILGRRDIDHEVMQANDIKPIDMVVVNLYPFQQTVARPDCDLATAIENIDIGGPAMLRAAAKNNAWVTVVVDSGDYGRVLDEMASAGGATTQKLRFDLGVRAFEHTARYDGAIAQYLGRQIDSGDEADPENRFPRTWNSQFERKQILRYGENPHQRAAFYVDSLQVDGINTGASVGTAVQIQGKALSYNNIADTDAALECVKQFNCRAQNEAGDAACVIVKHANPCGVALASSALTAYQKAYRTDPESAFGGIIAFNCEVDEPTARAIVEQQFVEVVIAPVVSDDAVSVFADKKNVRLLTTDFWTREQDPVDQYDMKRVGKGLLVQESDIALRSHLEVVSSRKPTAVEMADLEFAWRVAKYVKSNAIVYARDLSTIGVGAGQMSRVNSARIAAIKAEHAGLAVTGAVMASDAFFPFRDGLDQAGSAGIRAVIQPGGSMNDDEVIAAADQHDIAMVFTGMRHFRH